MDTATRVEYRLGNLWCQRGFRHGNVFRRGWRDGMRWIRSTVDEIHSPRGARFPFAVFDTADAIWKEVVFICLGSADAVVINATDLSNQVRWEMEACRAVLMPEQITFGLPHMRPNQGSISCLTY